LDFGIKVEILLNVVSDISLQRKVNWNVCFEVIFRKKKEGYRGFIDLKVLVVRHLQVEFLVKSHLETYICVYVNLYYTSVFIYLYVWLNVIEFTVVCNPNM
jgi:hypothetical protein